MVLLFRQGKERVSEGWTSKEVVERKMQNVGPCEFIFGFLSAEIKLTSYQLLQRDIQGDS